MASYYQGHPALLAAYERIFSGKDYLSRLQWLGLLTSLNYLIKIIRQLGWALYCSIAECLGTAKQKQTVEVLIVSHMFEKDKGGASDDLYFGPVARTLSARGLGVAVLYISHVKNRPLFTVKLKTKSGVRRYVLGKTMTFRSELRFLVGLLRESKSLKSSSGKFVGLEHLVRMAAAAEAFSPATFNALRIASQVEEMVTKLSPKCLLTTFEGHAWERVAFMKVHTVVPQLKCFGYQHSALFRLQHSISRPLDSMADPDLIFSSGLVATRQLSDSWGEEKVLMIGSPKAKVLRSSVEKKLKSGNRCLVLPEGIESEAILLTAFCLECAVAMPDIVFVLRFHPAFDYQALLKSAPQFSRLSSNVEISTGQTIEFESSSATWAIYRGSTAIIAAVEQGVIPVYFARDDEMTIDPLFALEGGRQVIKTVDDMSQIVMSGISPPFRGDELTAHCLEIFSTLNIETIISALQTKVD